MEMIYEGYIVTMINGETYFQFSHGITERTRDLCGMTMWKVWRNDEKMVFVNPAHIVSMESAEVTITDGQWTMANTSISIHE